MKQKHIGKNKKNKKNLKHTFFISYETLQRFYFKIWLQKWQERERQEIFEILSFLEGGGKKSHKTNFF